MIEKQPRIRKGVPPRNHVSYQTQRDIVIPAGTVLRSIGDDKFAAPIGFHGEYTITVRPGEQASDVFKRVVAA